MEQSADLTKYLNSRLPENIIGKPLPEETADKYIENYLLNTVNQKDLKSIEGSLKWRFLLDRHSLVKKKNKHRPKKTFLTRKERKYLNLLKLPKNGWNYQELEPMRKMWRQYMNQNLDLVNNRAPQPQDPDWASFSTVLAKSELIGAELTVVRSKVPTQVDLSGTVVLETKMTFQIVTKDNKLKTIVKDSSVFQFKLFGLKITVFGKHIATRPSERSVKKIKSMMCPDL